MCASVFYSLFHFFAATVSHQLTYDCGAPLFFFSRSLAANFSKIDFHNNFWQRMYTSLPPHCLALKLEFSDSKMRENKRHTGKIYANEIEYE